MSTEDQKPRLQRLPKVKARTGLSRSEIYRRVRANVFPAPLKVGPQTSVWDSREIDRWITEQLAGSGRGGAP